MYTVAIMDKDTLEIIEAHFNDYEAALSALNLICFTMDSGASNLRVRLLQYGEVLMTVES